MKRKSRSYNEYPPRRAPNQGGEGFVNYTSIAIFGGIFVLGVGVGIGFSTTVNTNSANVVNRDTIDRSAPNAEFCMQYGASAIVTDMRVFMTLNPFNVFVTQPTMQPGCVIRQNNWSLLEQQGLVSDDQVKDCKRRMNTFGFTGPLEGSPRITCIYQNDAAGNFFLDRSTDPPRESENF